jgi:hypothetical protein
MVHLFVVFEMRKLEVGMIWTTDHLSNVVRAIRLVQGSNGSAGNRVRNDWDFNGNKTNLIKHTTVLLKVSTRAVVALENPLYGIGGGMMDLAGT